MLENYRGKKINTFFPSQRVTAERKNMNTWKKPLELLREELKSFLSVTLEDAIQKVDQRFDEALNAMAQVEGQHLGLDPAEDEEMGSDDGFINDEPENPSSSSGDEMDDDDDDDLDDQEDDECDFDEIICLPTPPTKKKNKPKQEKKAKPETKKKRQGARAKMPPAVHYNMKPTVGKRERKPTRRFSPSRVTKEADEPESISGSESLSDEEAPATNRLDRDQWNVVRRLSPEQRNRNPWWSRCIAVPLNQVRDGCGYQSKNNQTPGIVLDAISLHPEGVRFEVLPVSREEKCALCGHKKTCTQRITLNDGSRHFVGRYCVNVAKTWHYMAELLADPQEVELNDIMSALGAVQAAHAAKADANKTNRYK